MAARRLGGPRIARVLKMVKSLPQLDIIANTREYLPRKGDTFDRCYINTRAALTFVSARALRGAPRLIFQIFLAIAGFAFITHLLPERVTSVTFGTAYTNALRWTFSKSDEDDGTGGGLRIVVFGSGDVATPVAVMGADGIVGRTGRSWTEYLCEELECSQHLSFVPTTDSDLYAITSKDLYSNALNSLETGGSSPGNDYSFVSEQYPNPTGLPDLSDQVATFLSSKPPKNPPKETLWVFSFGNWDVWSLASMPREQARSKLSALVVHLFQQIETLYAMSLVEDSIAYSDYWRYASDSVIDKIYDENQTMPLEPRERENFRILIPELFDISLTPGWHAQRPEPPAPHSKAEQMRNAAYLNTAWGEDVRSAMDAWLRSPDPAPEEEEEDEYEEEEPPKKTFLQYMPNFIRRTVEEPDYITVPYPKRMSLHYNLPFFILDAIAEAQLRHSELPDHNGIGARPSTETMRFAEVWEPCSWGTFSVDARGDGGEDEDEEFDDVCQIPGDYLFLTPFSVGDRARKEIARYAGMNAMVNLALGYQIDDDKEVANPGEVKGARPALRIKRHGEVTPPRVMRSVRM